MQPSFSRTGLLVLACSMIYATSRPASAQPISNYLPIVDSQLFGIDRSHSSLTFSARFMGMTDVEGTFGRYDAAILYDENDPTRTSVTLQIDAGSIDTNSGFRDRDLRSERFLDVESYPNILFESSGVAVQEDNTLTVTGNLTMRGVTREISFLVNSSGTPTADPIWGNLRLGYEGSTTISRSDFGVDGGDVWGFDVISDEISIEFFLLGTVMNMDKVTFNSQEHPSIGQVVQDELESSGIDSAMATFRRLREQEPDSYNFAESQLNHLGYKLIQKKRLDEAIAVFRLNAEAYPESANVYGSLGEAYSAAGDTAQAVANLRRALSMAPGNPVAIEILRHVE